MINRFSMQCLSLTLLWWRRPLYFSFLCIFRDFELLRILSYIYLLDKRGVMYETQTTQLVTLRSYSPREEFAVTGMCMKTREPSLQIDS